jgi:hypothetical protein
MSKLAPTEELAQVSAKLAGAWSFLSGQEREFGLAPDEVGPAQLAPYSFFMPLAVLAEGRTGGIGVLIERADAQAVAAHMFGTPAADIPEADLQDACSEVCNVFSDCIALHVCGEADVTIGLPTMVDANAYAHIAQHSATAAVYQGQSDAITLWVVVYHVFCQPE